MIDTVVTENLHFDVSAISEADRQSILLHPESELSLFQTACNDDEDDGDNDDVAAGAAGAADDEPQSPLPPASGAATTPDFQQRRLYEQETPSVCHGDSDGDLDGDPEDEDDAPCVAAGSPTGTVAAVKKKKAPRRTVTMRSGTRVMSISTPEYVPGIRHEVSEMF